MTDITKFADSATSKADELLLLLSINWDAYHEIIKFSPMDDFETAIMENLRKAEKTEVEPGDWFLQVMDEFEHADGFGFYYLLLVAGGYAFQAKNAEKKGALVTAWQHFATANYWLGVIHTTLASLENQNEQGEDEGVVRQVRKTLATIAAMAKLAADPKQADKVLVRECWDEWQKQPDRYKSKAAFARDMRDKFPNLESQPVIEGWCRAWGNES